MRVGLQLFCAVALAVFVFDQVSKYWAVSELTLANSTLYGETKAEEFGDKFERFWRVEHPARGRVVEVVADFWHFRYVENPGAAFGFLSRSDSPSSDLSSYFNCERVVPSALHALIAASAAVRPSNSFSSDIIFLFI